jgi:hydroxyacylglutathione hydrolase
MSNAPELARRYFEAIGARDLDAAMGMWAPGGVERVVGQREMGAPDGVREFLTEMHGAFPDLAWEVLDVIGADEAESRRVVVQWHATGTFAGPGTFQGSDAERIAEGVWLVRGGVPKVMNVYLIEDDGGVTVFDAGISDMTSAVAGAAARLGGIKRVVLGHADTDHRGAAPGLNAPVYCHPAEREAAESPETYRPYFDRSKLDVRGRTVLWRLIASWDGGPVQIAGTVNEGDEIAGFRVIHLPGHAPGLIGLFRESDRLALVSDTVYTLDPQSGRREPAHVPHPAFNQDTEQARASIRKLAALDPTTVWAGHADPVTGDVGAQLERAASA